eukprot:763519-Hanusia_phi.AAC.2
MCGNGATAVVVSEVSRKETRRRGEEGKEGCGHKEGKKGWSKRGSGGGDLLVFAYGKVISLSPKT